MREFVRVSGRRVVLEAVPVGNTVSKAISDMPYHWGRGNVTPGPDGPASRTQLVGEQDVQGPAGAFGRVSGVTCTRTPDDARLLAARPERRRARASLIPPAAFRSALEARLNAAAAVADLGDFFEFAVERVGAADVGAPGGGVRFRAEARVAGRPFETLAIDVGVGPTVPLVGDELQVPDLLGFAGISAPRVPAAPLERHLAEKLHALTRRYGADQPSSRPKDLIDILLISELAAFNADSLCAAVDRLFLERATHPVPGKLPAIPAEWARPYAAMAADVGLDTDLTQGRADAQAFLTPILGAHGQPGRWDPELRRWV